MLEVLAPPDVGCHLRFFPGGDGEATRRRPLRSERYHDPAFSAPGPRRTVSELTIIDEDVHTVTGTTEGGRLLVDADALEAALGWGLRAEGLCRGDVCVPVADPDALRVGGRLALAAVAAALRRPVVIDTDAAIAALGLSADEKRRALDGLEAPDFRLPDLDGATHALADWQG